ARKFLLYNLQNQLYHDFYCVGRAVPTPRRPIGHMVQGMVTPFVQGLSEANAGQGCWESGWQAVGTEDDGRVIARRGQLTRRARPQYCDGRGDGNDGAVRLHFTKEFLAISPGFYMALGDNDLAAGDNHELARFYWHITPDGAAPLLRLATTMLNDAGLPF